MAIPNGDSVFVGGSGDADCGDRALSMTGDRSCTGPFEVDPAVFVFGDGFESGDLSAWDQVTS